MQITLKVENLSVKLTEPSKQILNSICLHAKPGQILAVMGPSGSGKTTLLSAMSGRLKSTGRIFLNGNQLNKSLRRQICYVLQNDVFFPNLTLRQTLNYAAMLRLPKSLSHESKMRQVDQVIDALDLKSCENTIIGDYIRRGLSGGEKKRCSIACELLSNPSVMMLDEPTSSLDSATALNLIKLLKAYAIKEQKTIIVTIHQPSSQLFYMFDKLLLLNHGQMTYFGTVQQVIPYFQKFNFHMQHVSYNPGDFIIEIMKSIDEKELHKLSREAREYFVCNYKRNSLEGSIASGLVSQHENGSGKLNHNTLQHNFVHTDLTKQQQNHHHDETLTTSIHSSWSKIYIYDHDYDNYCYDDEEYSNQGAKESKWPSSFCTQVYALTSRNFIDGKARMLSKLNWVQTIGLALIAGAMWFQVRRTEETLGDIKGWMYFSTMYWMMFALFNAITSFPAECQVVNKERLSGSYRLSSYYIAKTIGELPLVIALPSVFHLISYPLLGYQNFGAFIGLWGFAILNSLAAQSVGMFIGFTFSSLELCVTIAALYSTSTLLFAGFYSATIPTYLTWIRYCSVVYYGYLNMQMVEFGIGAPVSCAINNSKYQSCLTNRHNETLSRQMSHTGHSNNYHITSNNEVITNQMYISRNEIIKALDPMAQSEPNTIFINTLCLIAFMVVFRLAGYIVLRIYHKPT